MSKTRVELMRNRLTTAEITYYMPDHPELLQVFVWQMLDQAPRYPRLARFLTYWQENVDAKVHSVRIAGSRLITPSSFAFADFEVTLH